MQTNAGARYIWRMPDKRRWVIAWMVLLGAGCSASPAPDGKACAEYGEQLFTANPERRIVEATVSHCRPAAEAGEAQAQYYLAGAYMFSDQAEVEKWMRRSAEGGYGSAQFYMATVYRTQQDRDMAKAVEMYEKAAASGVPPAPLELGAIYRNGIGMPADGTRAVYWYEYAYSRYQFRDAAEALMGIYRTGLPGVPKDEQKAELWRERRDSQKCPTAPMKTTVIC